MKNLFFILLFSLSIYLIGCNSNKDKEWIGNVVDVSLYQLKTNALKLQDTLLLPRSSWTYDDEAFLIKQLGHELPVPEDTNEVCFVKELDGQPRFCTIYDWTSGFFPGSLWYAYELTGDKELLQQAIRYTNILYPVRNVPGTHDLGFMINCSYGNAYRITGNDTITHVLVDAADALVNRFDKNIGCIRSWDFGSWNYPVIIDNMMNLELLFDVYNLTGNRKYYDVAVKHAVTTFKNHFRPDYTCFHVVSYNNDGTVEKRETHQGKDDNSAWSRGQGWALYGFTLCYKETHDKMFLDHAIHIANMIIEKNKNKDLIPYWDFDAQVLDDTPRDVSAACIIASALIELSGMVDNEQKANYFSYAEKILQNLSSAEYLSLKGENYGFILKHSTGSLPHNSEIDTPINYADYYFLEALKRYLDVIDSKI